MKRFAAVAALILVFSLAPPVFAASLSWNGAIGDSWNDAGNWLEGFVPGVGDDVTFNASTLINQIAQLGGDQAVYGITFNNYANSPIVIAAGGTLSIGSGGITLTATTAPSHTINADLNLTAPQTWNIAASGKTLTCNGNISGTSGLVKSGSGLLVLGGANSLSGTVRIAAGQLRLNNFSAMQNCTLDLASGDTGTLQFGTPGEYVLGGLTGSRNIAASTLTLAVGNNNETTTYSGVMGTGNFKKIGSGTLTLTNMQTITGTTRLCNGVLRTVGNFLQSSTLDMQADDVGTLESLSGPLTFGGLQGTRGLVFSASLPGLIVGYNNTSTTYSGSLSGTADLFQKIGTGTLTLAGDNSFSGTVQVTGGTLRLGHANALRNATLDTGTAPYGTLDLPAGTEYVLGGLVGSGNIYLPSGTTLDVGNANKMTIYSASFDGAGTLKKVGTAKLILNADSNLTGTVRLGAGALRVNSTALQHATLDLQESDTGTLESNNGGQVILGGLQGNGSLAFSSSLTTLTVGNSNLDTTFSGSLAGTTGTFQKSGWGTQTLAGDNPFAGTVRIVNGTLRLAHPNALANCTLNMATADSGSLTFASAGEYVVSALTGSRSITIPADTTLDIGNKDATATYSGVLAGGGNLTKIGSGWAILTGSCSFRGLTRPAAGVLQFGPTTLQYSTLDLRAGDTGLLDATGSGPAAIGGLQGTRDWAPADLASEVDVGFNNADTTYSGVLLGATGTLAKYGTGTLTLSGANTFYGMTKIVAGKIALANPKALQSSVLDYSTGTGALQFMPATENFLGGIIGTRALEIPAGVTLCIDAHDTIFQGILSGAGDLNVRDCTFTLTNYNTFTGVTRIPSGTLYVNGGALQYSTLDLNGADHGLFAPSSNPGIMTLGGLQGSRNLALPASSSFLLSIGNNNLDTTYSGSITGSSVLFWKIGTGNLTLSGVSSFTGETRVASGTLTLANPNALKNSVVNMYSRETGTLQFVPGAEYKIAGLTGDRNLNIPADTTLRVAPAGSIGYGAVLGGDGNLIKAGNGAFLLTGSCSLTGTVRIAAGPLVVAPDSLRFTTLDMRSEDTGTIASNAGLIRLGALTGSRNLAPSLGAFAQISVGYLDHDMVYSGSLSGEFTLEKVGLGKLTLVGNSDLRGGVAVSAGILQVDGAVPSALLLESGTLAGTGWVGSTSAGANCHIAPGDSGPGVLHLADLSLSPGAKLDYDLMTTDGSDLISMPASTLTLGGTLQFPDFTFKPLDGFGPGTYILIDAGHVSGDVGESSSGTIGGYEAKISIVDNDVVLTVVPEPSTLALLAIAIAGSIFYARARRRA